jgi:hypothetical protein
MIIICNVNSFKVNTEDGKLENNIIKKIFTLEMNQHELCKAFINDPKTNPITGRRLMYRKGPYNEFVALCESLGYTIPNSINNNININNPTPIIKITSVVQSPKPVIQAPKPVIRSPNPVIQSQKPVI